MKKLGLLTLTLALGLLGFVATPRALAAKADGKKAKLIAKYDTNKNGVIDADEKEALRKDFAKDKDGELKALDKNADGKLDDDEIAAIKPGSGKKSAGGSKKSDAESKKTDADTKKPESKKSE